MKLINIRVCIIFFHYILGSTTFAPGSEHECGIFGPGMVINSILNAWIKTVTSEHMFAEQFTRALDWPILYHPSCIIYYYICVYFIYLYRHNFHWRYNEYLWTKHAHTTYIVTFHTHNKFIYVYIIINMMKIEKGLRILSAKFIMILLMIRHNSAGLVFFSNHFILN